MVTLIAPRESIVSLRRRVRGLAFMYASLHYLTMNEQEPQLPSQDLEYVDVLAELRHGDFFDAVLQVESLLDAMNDAEHKASHIEVLEELFGLEYKDGICTILAASYQRQEDGYLTVRSDFLHGEGIVYEGVGIEAIDDEDRVVIRCKDGAGVEHFILPDSLLALGISETQVHEGIADILCQRVESFTDMVLGDHFLRMSYDAQQDKLQAELLHIQNDLAQYANGQQVELVSDAYYALSDANMAASLDDVYMDQSKNKYIESFRPSGKIIDVSLLERFECDDTSFFVDGPQPYRQLTDFTRSGGVPCVIVRDESVRVTYIVQLDKVKDIACLEMNDEDEDD